MVYPADPRDILRSEEDFGAPSLGFKGIVVEKLPYQLAGTK